MEVLAALGIDWKLFIAQIINFIVLIALLYKFLYKPVIGMLDAREEKVAASLKKAEEIEDAWKKAQLKEGTLLKEAREKAHVILVEAEKLAAAESARVREKTKEDIAKLVQEARAEIASDKEKAFEDLRKETAELVILASQKVLGDYSTKDIDKKMIAEVIKGL